MPMRIEAKSPGRRSCSQKSEVALSTGIRYEQSHHVDLPSNSSVIRGLEPGYIPLSSSFRGSNIVGTHSEVEDASRLKSSTELRSSTLLARTAARIPKPCFARIVEDKGQPICKP